MTDRPDENARPARPHTGGFTLDLSGSGSPPKRKKKAAPALVTRTINLSTKPAPPPEAAPAPPPPPAAPTPKREAKGDARVEQKREPRREGHSLADLLDPETLARLRGDG